MGNTSTNRRTKSNRCPFCCSTFAATTPSKNITLNAPNCTTPRCCEGTNSERTFTRSKEDSPKARMHYVAYNKPTKKHKKMKPEAHTNRLSAAVSYDMMSNASTATTRSWKP